MRELNKEEFDVEVLDSKGLVLVDFWATWCGPCRMLVPIMQQVSEERPDVKCFKVNVDECQDLAVMLNVYSVPTVILFEDGKVKTQFTGLKSKADILKLLEECA